MAMDRSLKSHVFFVGSLPHKVNFNKISDLWGNPIIEDAETYDFLCSLFHKSHIDAMIEAKGQIRPRFLSAVHHYCVPLDKRIPFSIFNSQTGQLNVLDGYKLRFKGLHLYCFPLGISLFAIEIDDSGSLLGDLTYAHSVIRELPSRWEQFNEAFRDALSPIKELVTGRNVEDLIPRGNKLKIFQIVLTESDSWSDDLLYEIATCSPPGTVGTDHHLAPSDQYYHSMINNNTIAPFKNWKSISLMDSYTALMKSESDIDIKNWEDDETRWVKSYYRLIYLRVLVQKAFLSSRNIQYRLNQSNSNLTRDLAKMEQYYFYDNISYNFLPDLLNRQMENGLGINEERTELSIQIKERENKKNNTLTNIVSVFAIFSITYDLYGIIKAATQSESVILPSVMGILAMLSIVVVLLLARKN